MLKARTKRKNKVREAAERKALEALGWVFIWSSQMTTDCDGMALIFPPMGLETVPLGEPWEQKDVRR